MTVTSFRRALCPWFSIIKKTGWLKSFQGKAMQIKNNKYMINSTQIANTEIFAFIAVIEPQNFVHKQKRQ